MVNEFFDALSSLETENKIETEILIDKVKTAMLKAVKKAYPDCEEYISIEIDPETKTFNMFITQDVVEDEPTYYNEVNIDVAKTIDKNAYIGGTIRTPLDIAKFSRAAAQTAKQSIKGDIREINKAQLLEKFKDKENECVTAEVSRVEAGGTVTVIYDETELYLFKNEQIPGEVLKEGQHVKIYITGITNKQKKPIIKISRSRKELVARLFELEVPEIYDGTVEIKAISREPGRRTKIAVWSKDKNVDPIGACIGPKRRRISSIVRELNGEKIDIIVWDEKPDVFIAKALAPSQVIKVIIYPGEVRSCMAVVPEGQLSLAIGNKGQNAKLAAKLTNYKIDIKPDTDPEAIEAMKKAEEMMQIDETEDSLFSDDSDILENNDNTGDILAEATDDEMLETIDLDLDIDSDSDVDTVETAQNVENTENTDSDKTVKNEEENVENTEEN
jgi:N utilization substance protein A